jgi:hypothetical protein
VPGGRVELVGSGFAVTLPGDWTVEVVDPDRDLTAQPAGSAWDALRARSPDGSRACAVSVGVAPEGVRPLEEGTGVGAVPAAEPRWTMHEGTPTLEMPDPMMLVRSASNRRSSTITSATRSAAADPALGHDVLYGMACAADAEWDTDAITSSLTVLPLP